MQAKDGIVFTRRRAVGDEAATTAGQPRDAGSLSSSPHKMEGANDKKAKKEKKKEKKEKKTANLAKKERLLLSDEQVQTAPAPAVEREWKPTSSGLLAANARETGVKTAMGHIPGQGLR